MCTDTKGRIAEAVEQMLQTRPVCKITVQRVMEQAQMKRQSFYYHYQDIYSVLEWIVETQLCAPLQYDGAQAPGEWCLQALTLLREKQPLLRKISHALGQETMYRLTGKVIRPQLARLLPDPAAVDGATREKQNKSLEYFKGGVSDVLFRGHRAADIMFRRSSDLVETELIK